MKKVFNLLGFAAILAAIFASFSCKNAADSDGGADSYKNHDSTVEISFEKGAESATGEMDAQNPVKNGNFSLPECGFSRKGYDFDGWTGSDGKEYADKEEISASSNLILTAKWTAKTYTVTLKNGDDSFTATMTYDSAEIKDVPAGKSLKLNGGEAYFAGWGTSQNFGIDKLEKPKLLLSANAEKVTDALIGADGNLKAAWTIDDENLVLYSYWSQIDFHTATFDKNCKDDSVKKPADIIVWENDANNQITLPTLGGKTGYTFAGWQIDGAGEPLKETYVLNGDKHFKAAWSPITYAIKFDANGGAGEMSPLTMTYDVAANLTSNEFSRANYDFAGWNTQADGNGTNYKNNASVENLSAAQGEEVALYAHWTAKTCAVTLMDGAETYATATMTYDSKEITVSEGKSLKLDDGAGYFAGWGTSQNFGVDKLEKPKLLLDASGETLADALIGADGNLKAAWTIDDENLTLYSYWSQIDFHTATFDKNCEDASVEKPDDIIAWEDDGYSIELPSFENRTGYTFSGWQIEGDDKTWQAGENYTLDGDKHFAAVWTAKSTEITFDAKDGAGGTASTTATYDAEMPEIALPTKTGYKFAGFFDSENGAGNQYYDENGASVKNWDKDAETATLYAKWNLENYPITYNLDGGENSPDNPANYTIETPTIALAAPTKKGYDFAGWHSDATCADDKKVTQIPQDSTGNKEFWAKWNLVAYNIAYKNGEATLDLSPKTYTVEDEVALPAPAPTEKIGYTFLGWLDDGGTVITKIAEGSTGDKTLLEIWDAQKYPITYKDEGGADFSGVHGENYPTTHTYGAKTTLVKPTRNGYEFLGWFANAECTGDALTSLGATAYTGGITLYAKWVKVYTLQEAIDALNAADKSKDISLKIVDDATDLEYSSTSGTLGNAVKGYNNEQGKVRLDLTGMTKLKSIGIYAFQYCRSLSSISIPASVTSIGDVAFVDCLLLESIEVDAANKNYKSLDGVLFSKDGAMLVLYPARKTETSYEIPKNVTSIGAGAFKYCASLKSIIIPAGVTSIGQGAFYNCQSLADVEFEGDAPPVFGYGVFHFIFSLEKIWVPDDSVPAYKAALENDGADIIKPISERPSN